MAESCDILYIHAIKDPTNDQQTKFGYMPMGIIGILNTLRARGIRVLGVNYMVEQALDPDFDLAAFLKNTEYRVLLTDLHWYEHSFGAMYVANVSKAVKPHLPVVIGGYTSTIFADEIMENFPCVDYLVSGDSDLPLEQLCDHLLGRLDIAPADIPNLRYRQDGKTLTSGCSWVQTSLDEIDFTNTDFFCHPEQIPYVGLGGMRYNYSEHWLCIARGCKYNCSYCCGANKNMKTLFGRCHILLRSARNVAQDFIRLTQRGIQRISPSHDFIMFGREYYREIFAGIRESGLRPGMYLECFQLPTREYIDDIAATFDLKNLVLVISPITGNEQLRRENGKYFSNDDFYGILDYMRQKGVTVQLYYTMNPAGETAGQFADTVFQMQYLRLKYRFTRNNLFYQRVILDPLAGMRDHPAVQAQYNTFLDYYRYCQMPYDRNNPEVGFTDGGQLPAAEKMAKYNALFPEHT